MAAEDVAPDSALAGSALVDRLRRDELDSIASEVAAGRHDHILKTLDERGRAQELVRQQYTGRYPFELLQNANDASGDETTHGHTARFVLTDSALLVADMGGGFAPEQIRAICGLGRSSKDPRKSIGYKGLGFKSVGEITDDPQIFSATLGFRFNDTLARREVARLAGELHRDQRLPVYALPFPITPSDVGSDGIEIERLLNREYRTVFRLPLRRGVERVQVAAHLEATLSPRLLLFLDATEQLELSGTDADFVATAVRQGHDGYTEMLLEAGGATEHWLVFERRIDIPSRDLVAPLGDAWREVEEVRTAVAVPLDEAGLPTRMEPQPVHVYFPTQEASGFGLLLQADFSLELDRRRIATTPEAGAYNSWLVAQLGELLGRDVASGLAARFPKEASVVSSLAVTGSPSDLGAALVDKTVASLRSSAFVPTVSDGPRLPGESLLLPKSVPDPILGHDLLSTADLGPLVVAGVEADPQARQFLAERLGAAELSIDDTLARLRRPADDESVQYYEFLVAWSERVGTRKFAPALHPIHCVRTVSGDWRPPHDRLFFPRQREEIEFPDGLEVPIVDVPDVDGLRPLLEAAGVSSFEWRQLLPDFIFPLLTDPETEDRRRALALEALRLYYQTERSGDPRLRAQAARVLLPARNSAGTAFDLRRAETVYFSGPWLDDDRLERLYGPLGQCEFLSREPPTDPDRKNEDFEFLEWLGVAAHPRPDPRVIDQRDTHMVGALSRHPHATQYEEHWEGWLKRPDVAAASRCDQGHSASQQLRASYGLDRFPDLVAAGDANRLSILWEGLAQAWGTHYRDSQWAAFYCQHTGHGGERTKKAPSLLAHLLEQLAWVPTHRRGSPELVQPRRAWRLTRDTPRRVAERVPALARSLDRQWASALCSDLGVVDAARPEAAHLVELLRGLADEWEATPAESPEARDVIDAARWTMRTLNDALAGDKSALESVDVPLLARLDGRRIFHPHPYVADDSLLAETWEPALPILDADRDLRQLHAVLGLASLDKLTTKTPAPMGVQPEAQAAVREELNAALPYLAAVAVEAVPSREQDVYRGLARLEVEVCENLIVRYELDGEVRQRGEAVAFIAVRTEHEGIIRRNIGTAHLELDPSTGRPHWYVFGPLLSRFLNVPTQGDAFSLLLSGSSTSRKEYLRSRRIPEEVLEEARIRLDQPPEEDDLGGLLPDLDADTNLDEAGSEGPPTQEATSSATSEPHSEAEVAIEDDEAMQPSPEPLPPLDHDAVTMADLDVGSAAAGTQSPAGGQTGGPGGLGPAGPVDHERRQRLQRTIGRRGEQAVFEAERRRVQASSGQDPDRVVWRSEHHPFAPYDIESIDPDGHTMYIEVKSTSGDDPYEPFEISHAELIWALRHRSRYYIYRVTNAHHAAPTISRFHDPVAMLREGSAELGLSGARLKFCSPESSAASNGAATHKGDL